jgi:TetR/AcrR family transcriptional regulator, transcriptional repressor of bet genes
LSSVRVGGREGPKYRRVSAAARRQSLIDATLTCLRRYGHDGVSVRRIGAAAGVSPGLINHHFPSTSTLIAASYQALARSLLDTLGKHAHDMSGDPRTRLQRFFQASFAAELLDPQLFASWLVFWSMASHSTAVRRVHDQTYGEYRATLESLLRQLRRSAAVPAFSVRHAAIGLTALLDGLWLEASLNPRTFRPAEAVALCEDWIDALCTGALPRLRSAASARRKSSTGSRPGR